jgi:hypothetical protein
MSSDNTNNYMKNYYEKNKDKFKEWSKKKIYCECCNKYITAPNYATHLKSASHLKNAEIQNKNKNNVPVDKVLQLMELFMNNINDETLKNKFNLLSQAMPQ